MADTTVDVAAEPIADPTAPEWRVLKVPGTAAARAALAAGPAVHPITGLQNVPPTASVTSLSVQSEFALPPRMDGGEPWHESCLRVKSLFPLKSARSRPAPPPQRPGPSFPTSQRPFRPLALDLRAPPPTPPACARPPRRARTSHPPSALGRRFPTGLRPRRHEGVSAGRNRARSDGAKYLGRKPAFSRAQFAAVREMLDKGTTSISQIAKATGVKRPTAYRLKDDPAAAKAALATWGM
jgi:hypothetical protein